MGFCAQAVSTGIINLQASGCVQKLHRPLFSELVAGNMKYSWSIDYLLIEVKPADGFIINHCILFMYHAIRLIEDVITILVIIYAFTCCGRD